jgi:hypothetical protein
MNGRLWGGTVPLLTIIPKNGEYTGQRSDMVQREGSESKRVAIAFCGLSMRSCHAFRSFVRAATTVAVPATRSLRSLRVHGGCR